jgi:hypothetical protein
VRPPLAIGSWIQLCIINIYICIYYL